MDGTFKFFRFNVFLVLYLVLILTWSIPGILGDTGNFSLTSPFSCGSTCHLLQEVGVYNITYCNANPTDCFNTIDDCEDGFNADDEFEYVENMWITNLNVSPGGNFTGGDIIQVTVLFDCDSDGDNYSIAYNNGSGWKNVLYGYCGVTAQFNISHNITLDGVTGNHSVRGLIGWAEDVPDPIGSNLTCAIQISEEYADSDDLTFYVQSPEDNTFPNVTAPLPSAGTTYELQEGLEIEVCVNATDNIGIDTVIANISWSSENQELQLSLDTVPTYCGDFSNITDAGTYNISFIVNDTSGNVNDSVTTNFTIVLTTNITVQSPTYGAILVYGSIQLNFTVGDGYDADAVFYSLDGGANTTITGGRFNISLTQSDNDGTRRENTTDYTNLSMSFKPAENMSVDLVSIKLKRNGSGTPNATIQIRTDNAGKPSDTALAYGNITNSSISAANYSFVNITLNITVNLAVNTTYWLFLTPNSSAPNFYSWESSDDDLYEDGNYSNNASLDLLFVVYDKYDYRTNIADVAKGNHTLVVYANSSSADPISSPQINFSVDYTSPVLGVDSFTYVPTSADNLDPSVSINFTSEVTDNVAISQVILQYKKQNDSAFQNNTMNNTSGDTYNGTVTPDSEGIWIIRLRANDTSGNNYTSDNFTLNITFETGWNRTPEIFDPAGGNLSDNLTLGNITINNTGDYNLSFNISKSSGTPTLHFNVTNPFIVPANDAVEVQVNVTVPDTAATYDVQIKVDNLNDSFSPDYLITNVSVLANNSGTHLRVEIREYDPTIVKGTNRILLQARIVNLGLTQANNISSTWTLPSGWSIRSNETINISSISLGDVYWHNITVNVGTSAAAGNVEISISVNCSENSTSTDSKTVAVSDPPGGDGDGDSDSSSSSTVPQPITMTLGTPLSAIIISIPEFIEVKRGNNTSFLVNITNSGDTDLIDLKPTIKNYLSAHHNITPVFLSNFTQGQNRSFTVSLYVPLYYGIGKHELNFSVNATSASGDGSYLFSSAFNLIVLKTDIAGFAECLINAREGRDTLLEQGYDVAMINELLAEAQSSFDDKDYEESNGQCQEAQKMIVAAPEVKKLLKDLTGKAAGFEEDSAFWKTLVLAQEAFERGDFLLAEKRVQEAQNIYLVAIAAEATFSWILKYWWAFVIILIASAVISKYVLKRTELKRNRHKLKELKKSEASVMELMKKIQATYFTRKMMSSRLYSKYMSSYRKRLAQIQKQRNSIELRKIMLSKINISEKYKRQKTKLLDLKKELQKQYFISKLIDKKTYTRLSIEYNRLLADVGKKLDEKEVSKVAEQPKKDTKKENEK